MPEQPRNHAESRLRMFEVSRVPLDPVHRGRPVPEGDSEALLPVVCGVREAPHGDDVLGKAVPHRLEHLTFVNVRFSERIAEHEERIDLDRRVRFDPVLDSPYPVVRPPPGVIASAEAGRVRRDGCLPLRKERQHVPVEALPDDRPSPTPVLHDEIRVVRNIIDLEVLREERKHVLRVAEGRIEQLPEEEGDQEGPFFDRRPAGASPVLPK